MLKDHKALELDKILLQLANETTCPDAAELAGESAIASGVELAVKTAVLLTALPLLNRLLSLLQEVLLL